MLAVVLLCVQPAAGDRSGDILFFDGAQDPFNLTYPASPGFVYVTPRKTVRGLPPWFEFSGSFSVQLWVYPQRMFLGTDIEQGVVGCLVRQTCGGCEQLRAGYGLTITSDSVLHFYLTVGIVTSNLELEVNTNEWIHVTMWYDADLVEARLYTSPGDGSPPTLTGKAQATQYLDEVPKGVNFDIHNDLLLGKFQPIYDREYYYSGYVDELRFWSKALTVPEMTDAIYRAYAPDTVSLIGLGIQGYWPMDAVMCSDALCNGVAAFQQWIHVGGISRYTASLVLYASPPDLASTVDDCRGEINSANSQSCLCNEFESDFCWNNVKDIPSYCSNCALGACHLMKCYGPFGAPKCLSVMSSSSTLNNSQTYEVEITACIDGDGLQKWTKSAEGEYGMVQLASHTLLCLTTRTVEPFRGSLPMLSPCIFDVEMDAQGNPIPEAHQAWQVDPTFLKLKNKLTGYCLTAGSTDNSAQPYLVDCINLDYLDVTTPVQSFLFDWAGGRNGILIGGAYLSYSDRCSGTSICQKGVSAPIDQPPEVVSVNMVALTSTKLELEGFAEEQFTLSITARDPNSNDRVQFGFFPYDEALKNDPSVLWPESFICSGGVYDTLNCTYNDAPAPSACPGGTCVANPDNGCPSNPCTRIFRWTPSLFIEFANPATLIFIARDIPTNELPATVALSQQARQVEIRVLVRMPPSFEPPTPRYTCEGGPEAGRTFSGQTSCAAQCESVGGVCRLPRFEIELGDTLSFTVRASGKEPGATIEILFLTEGAAFSSPPASRITVSETLPTISLELIDEVLTEVLVMNPVQKIWTFTPNTIDATRTYQVCFIAYIPTRGIIPSATSEVNCVEVYVRATNPQFDQPSPTNNSVLVGYVGCPVFFHMAAIKNDTSSYDLLVYPTRTYYQSLSGTLTPKGLLPLGAIFHPLEATDVTQVYTYNWVPEAGQEGKWLVCFATQDSFSVSIVNRCVFNDIQKCVRCVKSGESLELIGQLYRAHWLEMYAINPALHLNPSMLTPGSLINVGVMYRTPKLQSLRDLATYLQSTPDAIRRLNPDIESDDEQISAFKRVCVLPEVCGQTCGDAAYCQRVGPDDAAAVV